MYNIAGLYMDIMADSSINMDILEPFKSDFSGMPHTKVTIEGRDELIIEEKEILLDDCYKWYRDAMGRTVLYMPHPTSCKLVSKFICDYQWQNVTILYVKNIDGIEDAIAKHFCYTVFRNLILFYQGIFMHASSFIWKGKGIAVTAPSGTGKSTHASLWEKYYDAKVINDDCPAIKLVNGKPILFGNPWSGSSMKFMNSSAPLKAIVVLNQANENRIRKLNIEESTLSILPRFILPYYDNNLILTATGCIDKIINETPVFLLNCRPNKEAAKIAAERILECF